jgi:type II secretory pathway predicted ATPase ExeA
MWLRHWSIDRDPFEGPESPYVPLPSHEEAIARLVHVIEISRGRAMIAAAAGLGKTTVVNRAFSETRSPKRQFASVSWTADATALFAEVAERLGQRVGREPSRLGAWRTLERALRISALLQSQTIVAVDDACRMATSAAGRALDSLVGLGAAAGADLTIIQVARAERPAATEGFAASALAIKLAALTRSQAEDYLAAKLAKAGCTERIFTSRAMTRLHALSRGVPRKLQDLAVLCLVGGAARGLEVIPPELVDGVASECFAESGGGTWA